MGIVSSWSATLPWDYSPLPDTRKESAGPRWQCAPVNPLIPAGLRVLAATLICCIAGPFLQVAGHLLGITSSCSARKIDRGCCSHRGVSRPPDLGFRVANACVDLERAQRSLSAETVQTGDRETARAPLRLVVSPTLFVLRVSWRRSRRLQRVSG